MTRVMDMDLERKTRHHHLRKELCRELERRQSTSSTPPPAMTAVVERALSAPADGAILLVDGGRPLPQTRSCSCQTGTRRLKIIVVVVRSMCKDARAQGSAGHHDLFIDLDATEEQREFPVLTPSAATPWPCASWTPRVDLSPSSKPSPRVVPGPSYDPEEPSDAGFGPRLLRIPQPPRRGPQPTRHVRQQAMVCVNDGRPVPLRVTRLQAYEGLRLVDITGSHARRHRASSGMDDQQPSATPSLYQHPRASARLPRGQAHLWPCASPSTSPRRARGRTSSPQIAIAACSRSLINVLYQD